MNDFKGKQGTFDRIFASESIFEPSTYTREKKDKKERILATLEKIVNSEPVTRDELDQLAKDSGSAKVFADKGSWSNDKVLKESWAGAFDSLQKNANKWSDRWLELKREEDRATEGRSIKTPPEEVQRTAEKKWLKRLGKINVNDGDLTEEVSYARLEKTIKKLDSVVTSY